MQYNGSAQSPNISFSETNIQNLHSQSVFLSETFIKRDNQSQNLPEQYNLTES